MDSPADTLELLGQVPVREPDLFLDGELLRDGGKAGEATYLNGSAALIWSLCDGSASVREIVGLLEAAGIGDPAAVRSDVIAALREMETKGLIRMTGNERRVTK